MTKAHPSNKGKNTRHKHKISNRTTMKLYKSNNKSQKKSINKTLKRIKQTMELDETSEGILQSFRLTRKFVRRLLDHVENQNTNEDSRANISIFLSFLAYELYSVAQRHSVLFTNPPLEWLNEYINNVNETRRNISKLYNESRLVEDTNEYISDFFDMIDIEQIVNKFKIISKMNAKLNKKLIDENGSNNMKTLNMTSDLKNLGISSYHELQQLISLYSNFLQDTNRALWNTIRKYGDNLSTLTNESHKAVSPQNIDDIILGLSAMSMSSSSSSHNNINTLSNQLSSMALSKKSDKNIESITNDMIKLLGM